MMTDDFLLAFIPAQARIGRTRAVGIAITWLVISHRDITGPYTTPEEAWLGMYVADATRLGELNSQVEGVELGEDRQQRLRLGMSLADTYRRVWSSARGHWRVSPQTRYIVPSRFGYCPFVFRVAEGGWRRDSFEGSHDRFMATEGYWIDVERERLIHLGAPDPSDACLPTARVADEVPTEEDLAVARTLTGRIIALGAGQKRYYDSPAPKEPHVEL